MAKKKTTRSTTKAPQSSSIASFGPAAAYAWLGFTNECARFAVERMQQNLDAQRALMSCKTPVDVLEQQFSFYQAVSQLYTDQTTRFFERMSATVHQTAAEATQSYSRKYDDIPL